MKNKKKIIGVLKGSFLSNFVEGAIAFLISLKGQFENKVWETLT